MLLFSPTDLPSIVNCGRDQRGIRGEGTHKQPFPIRRPDHQPFAFARLWETWHDLDTFTIVTTEANATMRAVHDRMPLILSPEQIDEWLDPENPNPEAVLTSVPQDELELVPVSDWVNNARHEGPQCLKGIAQANGLSTMSEVEAQQLGVAFNS